MGVSRQVRVHSRGAEQVQSQDCLGKEFVPEGDRESRIGGTKAGDKMILECAYGAFGGIDPVVVGLD